MNLFARAFVFAVLVLVVVGAPLLELMIGGRIPFTLRERISVASVRTGALAKQIERAVAEESKVAKALRPRYQEFMFRAFSITHPTVVLGREDWLFHDVTTRDYPDPTARTALPESCGLVARVVRWFESNGTTVLVVPVPRKSTVHPEKLPRGWRSFTPVYDDLLAALRQAEVWTLDLRPALDPRNGVAFLRNDPHWTDEGAHRAAAAVAAMIRTRFSEEALPGRRLGATLRFGEPRPFVSGLMSMLEFPRQSPLYDRFIVTRRYAEAFDSGGRAVKASRVPEAIVVVGTSFSDGYEFPLMIGVELDRAVEDRSKMGRGAGYRVLDLAEEILLDRRPFPRILVWEFPEEFPLVRPSYFLDPLERILDVAPGRPYRAAPLAFESRRTNGIRVERDDAERLVGRTDHSDAHVEYRLDPPLPGDGSVALAYRFETRAVARHVVEWGTAESDRPAAATSRPLIGVNLLPHLMVTRLVTSDARRIAWIRVRPIVGQDAFTLHAPMVWTR